MIDTGAFATLLHRPFVKRMKIPLHDTPFSSAAVNLREHDVQVAHSEAETTCGHRLHLDSPEPRCHSAELPGQQCARGNWRPVTLIAAEWQVHLAPRAEVNVKVSLVVHLLRDCARPPQINPQNHHCPDISHSHRSKRKNEREEKLGGR